MTGDYIVKAGGAFLINLALFWLTLKHRVDVSVFVSMALSELAAMGVYHAKGNGAAVIPLSQLKPGE